jgi:hypothetical protein
MILGLTAVLISALMGQHLQHDPCALDGREQSSAEIVESLQNNWGNLSSVSV